MYCRQERQYETAMANCCERRIIAYLFQLAQSVKHDLTRARMILVRALLVYTRPMAPVYTFTARAIMICLQNFPGRESSY